AANAARGLRKDCLRQPGIAACFRPDRLDQWEHLRDQYRLHLPYSRASRIADTHRALVVRPDERHLDLSAFRADEGVRGIGLTVGRRCRRLSAARGIFGCRHRAAKARLHPNALSAARRSRIRRGPEYHRCLVQRRRGADSRAARSSRSAIVSNGDFEIGAYERMLRAALEGGYEFRPFDSICKELTPRSCLLRHDIDIELHGCGAMLDVERRLGVRATYFVMTRSTMYNLFCLESLA